MIAQTALRTLVTVFGLLTGSVVAYAYPSGLVTLPSADILAPGKVCASFGITTIPDDENDLTVYTQVGVFPFLEAGFDYSLTGRTGVGNIKLGHQIGPGALALGVRNMGDGEEWYAVYTPNDNNTDPFRIHLGLLSPHQNFTPFAGVEIPVKDASILLEGTGGDDPYGAVGVWVPIAKGFSTTISSLVGQPGGTQWYTELGCTFPRDHE